MFASKHNKFTAIIMAGGRGSRMTQLTADIPKALLPVANKPMIWYPINFLEKNGFKEVTIVVTKSSVTDIRKVLEDESLQVNIQRHYIHLPGNVDLEEFGTIDALKYINTKEKLKHDILVMSCDMVCDYFSLNKMMDIHRMNNSSVTMMFAEAPVITNTPVPKPKINRNIEKEYVGFDGSCPDKIVFLSTECSLEGKLNLEKFTSLRITSIDLHQNLTDCHLYMIKKDILQFFDRDKFLSLRTDFLPWLVDQTASNPVKQLKLTYGSNDSMDDMELFLELAKMNKDFDLEEEKKKLKESQDPLKKVTCFGYVANKDFTCIRANTLVTYCEINRIMAKKQSSQCDYSLSKASQICPVNLLGIFLKLGEKAVVKGSVLGNHCNIGVNCKIVDCVIMNHVTIEKNVILTGCIIGKNVHILENTELTSCLVSATQTISEGNHSNEEFLSMNQMMTI